MASVTTHRPDFDAAAARWQIVTDVIEGEDAVKDRGAAYLPRPSAQKKASDDEFYNAYRMRAEVPELVAPTVRGLVGTLHRKSAIVTLPPRLDGLHERASQDGLGLESFARRLSWDLIAYGRAPILVDLSRTGGMPRLIAYRPWEMINWREQVIDGEMRLTLAVLEIQREADEPSDPFGHDPIREWSVLRLVEGIYAIDIWRQSSEDDVPILVESGIVPRVRGEPLREIPLIVAGCNDVTPEIDEIPMLGLARLALSIYRNSADREEGLFLAGNPTPYITGAPPDTDPHTSQPAPIRLGPSGGYYIPDPAGRLQFAEVQGAGFSAQRENIQDKFDRAAQLGAAMLESTKRAAESGEALRLRQAAKTATLESVATAEGEAMTRALRIAALWADADPDDVSYEANTDFVEAMLTPQERTALIAGWIQGAYGRRTLYHGLQSGEALPPEMTFEDYLSDTEGPPADGQ